MINDRHMAVGDWSIELADDTPQWVRDEFRDGAAATDKFRSFVCFLETDVLGMDGSGLSQTVKEAFTDQVLWTGPVWRRGNKMRSFGGPSLMGFMGNTRGSPYLSSFGSGSPSFPATITQIIAAWFGSGNNGIMQGGAASATATTVDSMIYGSYLPPLKGPLDTAMAQTGNEYWIRPTGHLDWGTATNLFRSPPEVIIAEEMQTQVAGYRTLRVPRDGIQCDEDIDGYRNAAKVVSEDYDLEAGSGTAGATDSSVLGPDVRSWPDGDGVNFCGPIIHADSNDASDITALAAAASDLYSYTQREISVTCDDGCVLGFMQPGDYVYVYSIEDGIVDTDNEIQIDGQIIHPEILRVVAVRQPFSPGMGAYVVRYAGFSTWNITRITEYIKPETGATRVELGSPARPSVPPKYQSVLR